MVSALAASHPLAKAGLTPTAPIRPWPKEIQLPSKGRVNGTATVGLTSPVCSSCGGIGLDGPESCASAFSLFRGGGTYPPPKLVTATPVTSPWGTATAGFAL